MGTSGYDVVKRVVTSLKHLFLGLNIPALEMSEFNSQQPYAL